MFHTLRIRLSDDTYDRLLALYVALNPDMTSFSDFLSWVLDSVEIKNAPPASADV